MLRFKSVRQESWVTGGAGQCVYGDGPACAAVTRLGIQTADSVAMHRPPPPPTQHPNRMESS